MEEFKKIIESTGLLYYVVSVETPRINDFTQKLKKLNSLVDNIRNVYFAEALNLPEMAEYKDASDTLKKLEPIVNKHLLSLMHDILACINALEALTAKTAHQQKTFEYNQHLFPLATTEMLNSESVFYEAVRNLSKTLQMMCFPEEREAYLSKVRTEFELPEPELGAPARPDSAIANEKAIHVTPSPAVRPLSELLPPPSVPLFAFSPSLTAAYTPASTGTTVTIRPQSAFSGSPPSPFSLPGELLSPPPLSPPLHPAAAAAPPTLRASVFSPSSGLFENDEDDVELEI